MIQRKLSLKYLYAAFVARARINNGLPTTFYDSLLKVKPNTRQKRIYTQ